MRYVVSYISALFVLTAIILLVQPEIHKPIEITEHNFKTYQAIAVSSIPNNNYRNDINMHENKIPAEKNTELKTEKIQQDTKQPPKEKEVRLGIFSNYPVTEDIQVKTTKKETRNSIKNTTVQPSSSSYKKNETVNIPAKAANTNKTETQAAKQSTLNQNIVQTKPVPKKQELKTQQEEIIAWNQWNANVRNAILSELIIKRNAKEIKLSDGCTYTYNFTVNKDGSISNINTKASINNTESKLVQESLKNIITTLSGNNVLDFPQGSQKISYSISSNIAISKSINQDTKAKASDFSTYEKVIK